MGQRLLRSAICPGDFQGARHLNEMLADVEEANEQRMHSVADRIRRANRSTSVPTDYPRAQRSTAVELSTAATMTMKRDG